MRNRRSFLQAMSGLPVLGGLFASRAVSTSTAAAGRDFFKELGVRPFINAAGTYTALTASLMGPEVLEAIEYGSKKFVQLNELQDAVGRRLAELIGVEAAMVTSGAAAALTLGTAACVAGRNPEWIRRLPDIAASDMKSEFIIQRSHRYGYDHAVRNCGVRLIEVETGEELESVVSSRTAMMLFFNDADPRGAIKIDEFVALGRKHGIPTFNDAAADVPPTEHLSKYNKMGFDLVTFSGGKGLRGPQSAGLLLGRKDLIEAARMNGSPNSDSIGRGLKVNKEEMLGMLVAVERYLRRDAAAESREFERRARVISDSATAHKAVRAEVYVPPIANHVPHIRITWSRSAVGLAAADLRRQLREGEPSIEIVPGGSGADDAQEISIGVWQMQPGEAEMVGRRLRQLFRA
jgi:L-seryl-tRNA(Ser) seleniumtransferase